MGNTNAKTKTYLRFIMNSKIELKSLSTKVANQGGHDELGTKINEKANDFTNEEKELIVK